MTITKLPSKGKTPALLALAFTCLLLSTPLFVSAQTQQSSGTIAQGFQADTGNGDIIAGALVSMKPGSSNSVELATLESASRLAGVIDRSPLVSISTTTQEVQVVLSGTTSILVSNINGPIKASDKIAASPIAGVGMLATGDSQIVGTAQADFETAKAETKTIQDRNGKPRTVHIGYVPLQVGVSYYQAPGSGFLPPFLQGLANSIAGRPVSLTRVLFSSFLLLLGFINFAVLIYAAVRSAMSSLGRNPLAASAIRKGLYQTSVVALVVMSAALLASYLILSI